MNGKAWTLDWIARHDLRDGNGRRHAPYGVMTWQAGYYCHVCFDTHPSIGRKMHFMTMAALRDAVFMHKDEGPVGGKLKLGSVKNTGYGYLLGPEEVVGVNSISIEPYPPPPGRYDRQAVWIVKHHLSSCGYVSRCANPEEQIIGNDIMFYGKDDYSMEVKCREPDKKFPKLFVQVSETNPDRRI